jgi:uncharacterized ferritin-like protein (DUF455 family)
MTQPSCLSSAACDILQTGDAQEKVRLTFLYAKSWLDGHIIDVGEQTPPNEPTRPLHPILMIPTAMPRRRLGTEMGRIALIHAIAHIELNAIDLAWDIIARFSTEKLPKEFYDDWVQVAQDEARHFQMLNNRLADFNKTYGDLPAHNGLWDTAVKTHDDLMARLALVPLLLEPRGLDTTPPTVNKLRTMGDDQTADIMEQIGFEEISHVRAGIRWFTYMAERRNLDPVRSYHHYVRKHFKGGLKAPFNKEARERAGMTQDFYEPLTNSTGAA